MLTIESRYSGSYEIIGENRIMLCRVGTLETAVLVRSYLSGEDMTEDDKQTARAAIRAHDEDMQALHEAPGA
ncbi:MAG: hypothetical protein IJ662_06480 [Clostridia bacterium]|nr:hypothetical protein [Clostridia bacterium]